MAGVHEKPDLLKAFHEHRTRDFGGESEGLGPFPQKKIEFGIGGNAISRCREGLTCTIQSLLNRYSITHSFPSPHPPTLTISMQIWTNYETHKWGYIPQTPVAPTVTIISSDVKSSRPKWPRGQNFGLGLEALASASASRFWPRPGLDLVVLLCNLAFFMQKSCKIREFC